ncbi:hypothetical protein BU16DRAFT_544603 [Lophium mytilinum]|uniref:Uncharacterized protein n=1 Tax=Lophium mytilinum TaxID=390894 RepID=A0A6A6QB27_9PEZI|nr:hypothetical protein BU16DRAFT_544603 [Lophium mytilinum]
MSSPFDAEHWERVMRIVDEAWQSVLETINPHNIDPWILADLPQMCLLVANGETRWPASSGPGTGPWGEGSLPACPAILNRDLCDDAPQVMGQILMDIVQGGEDNVQVELLSMGVIAEQVAVVWGEDSYEGQTSYPHTVVRVTIPGHGSWILDLTRSQFGFKDAWIREEEYRQQHQAPGTLDIGCVPLDPTSRFDRARGIFDDLRYRLFAWFRITLAGQGLRSIHELVDLPADEARQGTEELLEIARCVLLKGGHVGGGQRGQGVSEGAGGRAAGAGPLRRSRRRGGKRGGSLTGTRANQATQTRGRTGWCRLQEGGIGFLALCRGLKSLCWNHCFM